MRLNVEKTESCRMAVSSALLSGPDQHGENRWIQIDIINKDHLFNIKKVSIL